MAIASLVLGIIGFFTLGLGSILALIFGLVGRKRIRESQGRVGGNGLAIAGIVLGALGVVLAGVLIGLIIYGSRHTASYEDGYNFGRANRGSNSSQVCNASANAPAGDNQIQWTVGCVAGINSKG